MAEKILITGASGFIGSHLVEAGLLKGYEIFAGTRAQSSREYLSDASIRFFRVNLDSRLELENQLEQFKDSGGCFDYVIHNAGITYAKGKSDFERVNHLGTQNLVDALVKTGTLSKKFLFISSLAAMGPGDSVQYQPLSLSDTPNPLSAYGKSKLAAETYIRSQTALHHLILRPTAVYGPRDKDFLSLFKLVNRGFEPIIGLHRQILSMVYVTDLCRAAFGLLESPHSNKTFMVSDGGNYEKSELGEAIRKALGKKTLRIKFPLAPLKTLVRGMEFFYSLFGQRPFLNLEKLQEISAANWGCEGKSPWQEIGLIPEYPLEAGVRCTAKWYQNEGWI